MTDAKIDLEHEGLFRRDYVYPLWLDLMSAPAASMDIMHRHLRKVFAAGEVAGSSKMNEMEGKLWKIIYSTNPRKMMPIGIEAAVTRLCQRAADADSAEDLLVQAHAEMARLRADAVNKDRLIAALESNAQETGDVLRSYSNTLQAMQRRAQGLEAEIKRLTSWTEQ